MFCILTYLYVLIHISNVFWICGEDRPKIAMTTVEKKTNTHKPKKRQILQGWFDNNASVVILLLKVSQ